ncbi:double-strand break repair helicase AddA [Oceanicella actignis]|uniref:double-strand break repair helicase AddA n=1 Tax=Oceanicella actignis TaxID=1189325 RepID=UPI0011E8618F|nr:double-strand break repair helicase AddA [Oceanicella actignis]TYO84801.1 DNA helicase/exodeoxyribonuclease V subunit A [Oceanicella actignis]
MTAPHDAASAGPARAEGAPRHDAATLAQIRAARPDRSAWISANAGSGKTRVLTERVARLLLEGAEPQRILCLTYTKAAAAEMQNRLFRTLGGWAMMDDAELAAALARLSEDAPRLGAAELARARRLFAKALETPGGLKIQTIHAFCDALLRRFPLEAGVSPRFEVLDERQAAALNEAIRDRMAAAAEAGEDQVFDAVAAGMAEDALAELLAQILAARDAFPEDAMGRLARLLGIDPGLAPEAALAQAARAIPRARLARLADLVDEGGKRAKDWAARARAFLAEVHDDPLDALAAFEAATLKKDGAPYDPEWLLGKKLLERTPEAREAFETLSAEAAALADRRRALNLFARAQALHRFARVFLDAVAREKAAAGALDFADLVERARALLSDSEAAAWALWKLDGGIDHLLIDEAQDTAPAQWAVVRALADEFFAGKGAREVARTLFVVGDEKQSIYSFQGADPAAFARMRALFAERLRDAPEPLHCGELAHSFRSAPAVLTLVDEVFRGEAARGLSGDGAEPRHVPFKADAPGLVELWPFLEPDPESDPPPWSMPVDAPAPANPRLALADRLARHIAELIHEGAPLPDGKGGWRPMRAGDVLVLVRRRDILARTLIRRLKALGVDVAGADRMRLTDELAVRDLLSLLRAAADAEDDLSLAEALRSPLCGLSEEALFALAHGRRGTLFEALERAGERFADALALVRDMRRHADFERPYELLERALTRHEGRRRLLARLGPECEDAIDELLAAALEHERRETPTLTGFLAWLEGDETEIKREMGAEADELRVMTVHGAKGLEAPFVVLPDTAPRVRKGGRRAVIEARIEGEKIALPAVSARDAPERLAETLAELDRREEDEARRLLYVALTRAESRLLICGAGALRGQEDKVEEKLSASWWGMIRDGLERAMAACAGRPGVETRAAPEAAPPEPMMRLAWGWTPPAAAMGVEARGAGAGRAAAAPEAPEPAGPVPPAPPAPRRLSPSAAEGATEARAEGAAQGAAPGARDRETAQRMGDLVHLLIERLAPLAPERRAPAAEALAAEAGQGLAPALRAEACAQALDALAHPRIAALLEDGAALFEAGFSALAAPGLRVAGRMDLVRVGDEAIDLVDFKSGAPPADGAPTPAAYLEQMALYRAALARLHPGATVRAALFWTQARRFDALDPAALEAALAARLAAEGAGGAGGQAGRGGGAA